MLYEINLRISLGRVSFADFNLYHMLLSKPAHLIIFSRYALICMKTLGQTLKNTVLKEKSPATRIYARVRYLIYM